jgi:Domain of unknown function (DUF5122) beta-propeller
VWSAKGLGDVLTSRNRVLTAALAALLAVLVAPAVAGAAPSSGVTEKWTFLGRYASSSNEGVLSTARAGNTVYFGGNFAGVARRTGPFAAFDSQSAALEDTPEFEPAPGTSTLPSVTAAVPDGDGGWYVAGSFEAVGGVRQPGLARIGADDTVDRTFRPRIDRVSDLEVGPGGVLYVAGSFTQVDGEPRNGLAALDPETGSVKPWNPQVTRQSGSVEGMAEIELTDETAYVAGNIARVADIERVGLAEVKLSDGAPTSWNPHALNGTDPARVFRALELVGDTVYVAGDFTRVGGEDRAGLAALEAADDGPARPWDPSPGGGSVHALAVHGSAVYVGGGFSVIGGQEGQQPSLPQVAKLEPSDDDSIGVADETWRPNPNQGTSISGGPVSAILPTDAGIYIGGGFSALENDRFCGLALVSPDSGEPVDAWNPDLVTTVTGCVDSSTQVNVIRRAGDRVWAGGNFIAADYHDRLGMAAIDAESGELTDWAPSLEPLTNPSPGRPFAMAASPDEKTIYVAGNFTEVNDVTRNGAAAVAATEDATVRSWNPNVTGNVLAIEASSNGTVYLGGSFSAVGGNTALARLAAVDDDEAGTPVADWQPKPNLGMVTDIVADPDPGGPVYVAGGFTQIGEPEDPENPVQPTRNRVAAIDPATGEATDWDVGLPSSGATVNDLALADGIVYVAGDFDFTGEFDSEPGPDLRNNLMAVTDAADPAVTSFAPNPDNTVRTVTVAPDGTVYVFGTFDGFAAFPDRPRDGVASLSPAGELTGWSPLGHVFSVANYRGEPQFAGGSVFVGGAGNQIGNLHQAKVGIYGTATAPQPVAPPTIEGTGLIDQPLTCRPGEYAGSYPLGLRYRWLRGGQPIEGANTTTYRPTPDDSNTDISCEEIAGNAAGEAVLQSDVVRAVGQAPDNSVPPEVSGTARVGSQVSCTNGGWNNSADPDLFAYEWLIDDEPIDGAEGRTFTPAAADEAHSLACRVTAANAAGTSEPATSSAVTVLAALPANTARPAIEGAPAVGATLTCRPGSWENTETLAYAWLRNGQPIGGATGSSYTLTGDDAGYVLVCRVTGTGRGGSASADSNEVPFAALAGPTPVPPPPTPPPPPGPPPADPPSNAVAIARAKGSSKAIKLSLRLPGPGRIVVTGSAKPRRGKAIRLSRSTAMAPAAGNRTVTLKLNSKARRALRRSPLRVTLRVSFTPNGGSARTIRRTVTVKPAKGSRS